MRFKRFSAMLLALAMCMGVFSTTVFAYSDESATTTTNHYYGKGRNRGNCL